MIIEGHLNLVFNIDRRPVTQYTRPEHSSSVSFGISTLFLDQTGRLNGAITESLTNLGHRIGELHPILVRAQVELS
ncbi:MAG TPA: hypothetical protein VIH55_02000, partial [Acidimicrobiia bacterium]